MKRKGISILLLFTFSFLSPLSAQTEKEKLSATILHLDSLFWAAYNRCDVLEMTQFFSDDLEFYHDKGGSTIGLEKFTEAIRNGLCGKEDFRLRREAIPETVSIFPMENNQVVYGAIISGEHLFYILEKGQPEYLDGHARFSHLWLFQNNQWKMARILSYDHGPAYKKE